MRKLPNFYAGMLRSYVNRLNVTATPGQQRNIWGTDTYHSINVAMIKSGFVEVADLPIVNGVIDYCQIQYTLQQQGYRENVFLLCAALQTKFKLVLGCLKSDRAFPLYLQIGSKKLLKIQQSIIINYSTWELALGIQIELAEIWKSFKSMLKKCKVTKFYEINFKIFH